MKTVEDIFVICSKIPNKKSPTGSPQLSPVTTKMQCHNMCRTCAIKCSNCIM